MRLFRHFEGDCDCNGNVLDECGVCGGDGIPAGDCDPRMAQLDACGVRGPCEADADSDGIRRHRPMRVNSMPVTYATDLVRSTNAVVQTSPKETAIDGNVLDECGVCGGDGILPATATAMAIA